MDGAKRTEIMLAVKNGLKALLQNMDPRDHQGTKVARNQTPKLVSQATDSRP
jgi:hypothetical protein